MTKTEFKKLSKDEKRKAVLKDAMQQMLAGHFLAKPWTFIAVKGFRDPDGDYVKERERITDGKAKVCHVCAKGAVALSYFRKAGELEHYDTCQEGPLAKLIPAKTLNRMESDFELRNYLNGDRFNQYSPSLNDRIPEAARLYAVLKSALKLPYVSPTPAQAKKWWKEARHAYKIKLAKARERAKKVKAKKP